MMRIKTTCRDFLDVFIPPAYIDNRALARVTDVGIAMNIVSPSDAWFSKLRVRSGAFEEYEVDMGRLGNEDNEVVFMLDKLVDAVKNYPKSSDLLLRFEDGLFHLETKNYSYRIRSDDPIVFNTFDRDHPSPLENTVTAVVPSREFRKAVDMVSDVSSAVRLQVEDRDQLVVYSEDDDKMERSEMRIDADIELDGITEADLPECAMYSIQYLGDLTKGGTRTDKLEIKFADKYVGYFNMVGLIEGASMEHYVAPRIDRTGHGSY